MTDDVGKGIIDRFRSLPMARSVGPDRPVASRDVVYNGGILIVLMLSGLFVGWTVNTGLGGLLAGVGCSPSLFAFAMSWLGIWLGLPVPTVEVANQVVFTVLFPITFISNVFVPVETLPTWLQPVAEWNPTSTLTELAARAVGQPEPVRDRQLPVAEPDPRHARVVVVFVAVLRPAGRPPLPEHEPLTGCCPPRGCWPSPSSSACSS